MPVYDKEMLFQESRQRFLNLDQDALLSTMGFDHDVDTITVPFLGQDYSLNRHTGEVWLGDSPAPSCDAVPILDFVNHCASAPSLTGKWLSSDQCYPEHSIDLTSYTEALSVFDGNLSDLKQACRYLDGIPSSSGDVGFIFPVFPGLPVWFQYWEKEEDFDSNLTLLWDSTTPDHLDASSVPCILDSLIGRITG